MAPKKKFTVSPETSLSGLSPDEYAAWKASQTGPGKKIRYGDISPGANRGGGRGLLGGSASEAMRQGSDIAANYDPAAAPKIGTLPERVLSGVQKGNYWPLVGAALLGPLSPFVSYAEALHPPEDKPTTAPEEGKDPVQRVRDDKTLGEKHQDMLAKAGIGGAGQAQGIPYATKTSTTVRKGIDLEKMGGFGPKHFMRASDQQKVALRDRAKAQAETNQQLAQEYFKLPQEKEAAAEEYEDQRMAVQHQVQQVRTRLAQMEREAAKEVVDPDRYWDNADIGKKMAYITAAADAGAAAGFMGRAGGANPILAMASRMIVADINAQKSNIAFAAGRRGEVRGLLGSLQRQVKDIGTAEALTYKRLAMDTSDRLKGIALQSSSPSLKARAEAAAGALDQKAMQMGNQAAAMMADRISQTTQRVPFRAGGAGGKKKDDFEQRKYAALAGLNRLGDFIKLADASWVEALKFAAPRDISARAEQYTTTRTTTALAVWKMFDNGKLSDQDLRVALTLLKPKWTMIHSWTRRPAKANLAEMRRRLTAGRKLKAAMHSGKTYDTSAKAKAALKVQWREQGLPTE